MDSLSKIIATVHATVHDFKLMKQYSVPKIYHGGESFDLSSKSLNSPPIKGKTCYQLYKLFFPNDVALKIVISICH